MDDDRCAKAQLSEILRQQTLIMLRSTSLVGWLVEWGEIGGICGRSRGVVISETINRSKASADGSYPSYVLFLYQMNVRSMISLDTADCKIMKVYPYLREYVIIASHWEESAASSMDEQPFYNCSGRPEQGRRETLLRIIEAELEQRGVCERLDELAARLPPSKGASESSLPCDASSQAYEQGLSGFKFGALKNALPRGGLQSREEFLRRGDNAAAKTANRSPQSSPVPLSASKEISMTLMDGSPTSVDATSSQPFKSQSHSQLHIHEEERENIPQVSDACRLQPPQSLNEAVSDDDASQSTYSSAEGSVGSQLRRIARRQRAKLAPHLIAYQEPPIRRSTADEIMAVFEEKAPMVLRPLGNNKPAFERSELNQSDRFTINIPAAIEDHSCSPKAHIHHERKRVDRPRRPDFGSALTISSVSASIPGLCAIGTDEEAHRSPLTLKSIMNRPLQLSTVGKHNSMWKIDPIDDNTDIEAASPKKGPSSLTPMEDTFKASKKKNLFKEKSNFIIRTMKPLARLAPLKSVASSEKIIKLKSP
jgi:hypothetical protein